MLIPYDPAIMALPTKERLAATRVTSGFQNFAALNDEAWHQAFRVITNYKTLIVESMATQERLDGTLQGLRSRVAHILQMDRWQISAKVDTSDPREPSLQIIIRPANSPMLYTEVSLHTGGGLRFASDWL